MSTSSKIRNLFPGLDITAKKDGTFVLRRGYFYRHGMDEEKLAANVLKTMETSPFVTKIIDKGDHFAAFRGGAKTKNQSHFWVHISVTNKE
jgi:hypothetical protein